MHGLVQKLAHFRFRRFVPITHVKSHRKHGDRSDCDLVMDNCAITELLVELPVLLHQPFEASVDCVSR